MCFTVLGARTVDQLRDNLAAAELFLDAAAVARLDEVSAPVLPEYLYGLLDEVTASRRVLRDRGARG